MPLAISGTSSALRSFLSLGIISHVPRRTTRGKQRIVNICPPDSAAECRHNGEVKIASTPQPPAQSRVRIYAQDARVGPVIEDTVEVAKIGRRLEGPRIGIWDQEVMKASADAQGNYLIGPERRQFDQVQAFVSSQRTLDLFEGYAERRLPWAFESETLGVGPHAGEGANAYYQRFAESLSFYYFDSKALGKRVQTAQSADVVSHETGHAILDGLKPEYGHTFERETKAFHEAFGDCAAMLLTLARPSNCQNILQETGGDLRRENCLSRLGEEFGAAVRRLNQSPKDDRDYLRTHLNDYLYVDPNTLPSDGPRDELSGESHSFCQVWTRGFYHLIEDLFRQSGQATPEALQAAGEVAGKLLTLGVEMASPARARYQQIASAMLRADDVLYQGQNRAFIESAFERAGIVPEQTSTPEFTWTTPPTSPDQAQALVDQIVGPGYTLQRQVAGGRGLTFIEALRKEGRCLGHQAPHLSSEVAEGVTLTFDAQGRLIHQALDPKADGEARGLLDELARPNGRTPSWERLRGLPDGTTLVARLPVFED